MKYIIKVTRKYESDIIDTNSEKEAHELFATGDFGIHQISEKISGIKELKMGIDKDEKLICQIDKSYYDGSQKLNIIHVFNFVYNFLADKGKEPDAIKMYDILENQYIVCKENPMTMSDVFDFIDEYVTLLPITCREKYIEWDAKRKT